MVAAGAEHTAAVTEDGELYGWGWGRYGNLGLGDRNDRLVPEKVSADVVGIFYGMFMLITIRLFINYSDNTVLLSLRLCFVVSKNLFNLYLLLLKKMYCWQPTQFNSSFLSILLSFF